MLLNDWLVIALVLGVMFAALAGQWWLFARRNRPLTAAERAWLRWGERAAGWAGLAVGLVAAARVWSTTGSGVGAWPAALGSAVLLACGGVTVMAGVADGRGSGGWPVRAFLVFQVALMVLFLVVLVLDSSHILAPGLPSVPSLVLLSIALTAFCASASGRLLPEAERAVDA